ncbi:hypothetical protein B0H14DRAFT_3426299 [Mycena olivaceomarginata]|nr:hypothetical protein B0H14DRAFT_3426299 [Mycena olivaceomarginata]
MSLSACSPPHAGSTCAEPVFVRSGASTRSDLNRDPPSRAAVWPCCVPPYTIGLVTRAHPSLNSALHSVGVRNQAHRTVDNPRLSSAASIPGTLGLPLLYSRAGLGTPAYALGQDLPASSPVRAGDENHAWEGGDRRWIYSERWMGSIETHLDIALRYSGRPPAHICLPPRTLPSGCRRTLLRPRQPWHVPRHRIVPRSCNALRPPGLESLREQVIQRGPARAPARGGMVSMTAHGASPPLPTMRGVIYAYALRRPPTPIPTTSASTRTGSIAVQRPSVLLSCRIPPPRHAPRIPVIPRAKRRDRRLVSGCLADEIVPGGRRATDGGDRRRMLQTVRLGWDGVGMDARALSSLRQYEPPILPPTPPSRLTPSHTTAWYARADTKPLLILDSLPPCPRLVCLCFAVVDRSGRVSPSPFPSGAQKQRRILPATVIFTSAAACQRACRRRRDRASEYGLASLPNFRGPSDCSVLIALIFLPFTGFDSTRGTAAASMCASASLPAAAPIAAARGHHACGSEIRDCMRDGAGARARAVLPRRRAVAGVREREAGCALGLICGRARSTPAVLLPSNPIPCPVHVVALESRISNAGILAILAALNDLLLDACTRRTTSLRVQQPVVVCVWG